MWSYGAFNCTVLQNGEETEWFQASTRVKQGCIMSGFLFLVIIDYIMKRAIGREPTGIRKNFYY
jgi:hypothetical protein